MLCGSHTRYNLTFSSPLSLSPAVSCKQNAHNWPTQITLIFCREKRKKNLLTFEHPLQFFYLLLLRKVYGCYFVVYCTVIVTVIKRSCSLKARLQLVLFCADFWGIKPRAAEISAENRRNQGGCSSRRTRDWSSGQEDFGRKGRWCLIWT